MTTNRAALAQRVELWPTEWLTAYERGARKPPAKQVQRIARSIRAFGFAGPILIDSKMGIVTGHGQLCAARLIGLRDVPVVVLDRLQRALREAYLAADRSLAASDGWDEKALAAELHKLETDGLINELVGFFDAELQSLTTQP